MDNQNQNQQNIPQTTFPTHGDSSDNTQLSVQGSSLPQPNVNSINNTTHITGVQDQQGTKIYQTKPKQTQQPTITKSYHPISTPHKEQGPVTHTSESITPSDVNEVQPEISVELQEAGVETTRNEEQMQLTLEDTLAGMEHAKESVPVPVAPSTGMQIPNQPFTLSEAITILKSTKTDDAKHWLAVLLIVVLHKKHFQELHKKFEEKSELLQKIA